MVNTHANTVVFWSMANSPMTHVTPISGRRITILLRALLHNHTDYTDFFKKTFLPVVLIGLEWLAILNNVEPPNGHTWEPAFCPL